MILQTTSKRACLRALFALTHLHQSTDTIWDFPFPVTLHALPSLPNAVALFMPTFHALFVVHLASEDAPSSPRSKQQQQQRGEQSDDEETGGFIECFSLNAGNLSADGFFAVYNSTAYLGTSTSRAQARTRDTPARVAVVDDALADAFGYDGDSTLAQTRS